MNALFVTTVAKSCRCVYVCVRAHAVFTLDVCVGLMGEIRLMSNASLDYSDAAGIFICFI